MTETMMTARPPEAESTAPAAPPATPASARFAWRADGPRTPAAPGGEAHRAGVELLRAALAARPDPILQAELDRLTAPPPPPEPPPDALATPELLARLPGRHDLIAAVATRLCEELGDRNGPTWSFATKAAGSVASRSVPALVLSSCLSQATGPRSAHRGKVFVAAWRREAGAG